MEKLIKPFRIVFCISLMGMVIPLAIHGNFNGDFLPPWPHLHFVPFWVALFAVLVVIACLTATFTSKPRLASTLLGSLLLAVYLFGYVTYDVFIEPQHRHFIAWAAELTESALAGGAFVVAATFPREMGTEKSGLLKVLEKLIPLGPFLFCATMILYGLMHLIYPGLVAQLIPAWFPAAVPCTYVAGVLLMLTGIAILFKIKRETAALLLGIMIFTWLCIIHIPRAINDLRHHQVWEFSRAFGALAFISTAFVISGTAARKKI